MNILTVGAALAATVVCIAATASSAAEAQGLEIVYPPKSGVFNVVTDGGVDNTGKTDVTEKLQKILYDGTNATGRRLQVLYFPKGTYLVSGALIMKVDISRTETSHSHGPWLVGQSRTETIIRLKDGAWPTPVFDLTKPDEKGKYPDRLEKQVVLSTGDCTNTTFNKIVRNLTVNIGKNNGGAIGVQYNTSNSGYLGDVDIVSEDGAGTAGLALAGVENGPGQIRNVTIKGFDIGLYCVSDYVIASSDITIDGARKLGVFNRGFIAGEDFTIRMAGEGAAIHSKGPLALVGAKLAGKGPAGIVNEDMLYARNIEAAGFADAISGGKTPAPKGGKIDEYYSGKSAGLFKDAKTALKLPIKKVPLVPYEKDFSKWTSPMQHGAVGDGKSDDSDAVQKALNAPGKTHVVFEYDRMYRITKALTLGPDVVRVLGTHGRLPWDIETQAGITIGEGKSPVVVIEGLTRVPPLHVRTGRTVVIDSVNSQPNRPPGKGNPPKYFPVGFFFEGTGDVFVNNSATTFEVLSARQNVWLRHYNSELGSQAQRAPVDVTAGAVWLLGWKSENLQQRVRVRKEGAMEVIGFNNYEVGVKVQKDGDWPIFEVIDGKFSCDLLSQRGAFSNLNLVWETRDGLTRKLTRTTNPDGKNCALYTGYP
jgi:hypothetical protein